MCAKNPEILGVKFMLNSGATLWCTENKQNIRAELRPFPKMFLKITWHTGAKKP